MRRVGPLQAARGAARGWRSVWRVHPGLCCKQLHHRSLPSSPCNPPSTCQPSRSLLLPSFTPSLPLLPPLARSLAPVLVHPAPPRWCSPLSFITTPVSIPSSPLPYADSLVPLFPPWLTSVLPLLSLSTLASRMQSRWTELADAAERALELCASLDGGGEEGRKELEMSYSTSISLLYAQVPLLMLPLAAASLGTSRLGSPLTLISSTAAYSAPHPNTRSASDLSNSFSQLFLLATPALLSFSFLQHQLFSAPHSINTSFLCRSASFAQRSSDAQIHVRLKL